MFDAWYTFLCPGIFYFTLGNVSPKFRSKLSIQLVAIDLHSDLMTYGMDAIIRPFIEDVMKLVNNIFAYRVSLSTV
jgi:hypothetical protein